MLQSWDATSPQRKQPEEKKGKKREKCRRESGKCDDRHKTRISRNVIKLYQGFSEIVRFATGRPHIQSLTNQHELSSCSVFLVSIHTSKTNMNVFENILISDRAVLLCFIQKILHVTPVWPKKNLGYLSEEYRRHQTKLILTPYEKWIHSFWNTFPKEWFPRRYKK